MNFAETTKTPESAGMISNEAFFSLSMRTKIVSDFSLQTRYAACNSPTY